MDIYGHLFPGRTTGERAAAERTLPAWRPMIRNGRDINEMWQHSQDHLQIARAATIRVTLSRCLPFGVHQTT